MIEKNVMFSNIKVGDFFKDLNGSSWYLKVNSSEGMYESNGVRGQCKFYPNENVISGLRN